MAIAEQRGAVIPTFNLSESRIFRPIAVAAVALGMTAAAGCLPEQIETAYEICSDQPDVKACLGGIARLHQIKTKVDYINDSMAPSDAALDRLAQCESGGNYAAVNPSGKYRGRYQFDQRTWDANARDAGIPEFAGISPDDAENEVQDAMARNLYSDRGRSPWPECGRRI